MTASKRKNEHVEDVSSQVAKMVIVGDSNDKENNSNQESQPVLTAIEKMKKLSMQWEQGPTMGFKNVDKSKPYDAIAQSLASIINDNTDVEMKNTMLQKAEGIKSRLSNEIDQAKDLRGKETDALGVLSTQLSKFHQQRKNLLREIDDLDNRQRVSQEKIAMYQAEASQELDTIIDVEEEQKRQVPRLKMTISLYASATGIKWDFEDPDLLSGQVVSQRMSLYRCIVATVTVKRLTTSLWNRIISLASTLLTGNTIAKFFPAL